MPAPLRVILSDAEASMLRELRVAITVPRRTRDGADMPWLNDDGWNVPAIADTFDRHEHTVRATIGIGKGWAIWIVGSPRSGWKAELEGRRYGLYRACSNDGTRTYTSAEIVRKLKDEGSVDEQRSIASDSQKKTIAGTNLSQSSEKARPVKR